MVLAHHRLDPPEQDLVLDLLVAEPHQGLQRILVAQRVLPAHVDQLGGDEAFDQAEDVGVGAALDLAHEAHLGRRKRQLACQRQTVGQVLPGSVEAPPLDDVLVDIPANGLGGLDGARISGAVGQGNDGVHVSLHPVVWRARDIPCRCAGCRPDGRGRL
jgi:hypothetical protein